ncbi:hypothetical protein M422DRAFT_253237 [Sphaerobolus stellatus SS14]|uniref:Uncharacterized protein n=1 Tax=Sphaerobolus stellatus (strain SS14) TaxID=990650 RepID=A0A0C9VY23_SPHS4|nr:hypothetical protein M422DRAFT_253237 [Sphaerobolus stellatus SS14]
MKEDSRDEIERTGSACHTRFKLLIKHQKKNETCSLQKTGTNEEIDDHIKVMINLVDLVEGYEASKEGFMASTKKQQEMQQKATLQMCASVHEARLTNEYLLRTVTPLLPPVLPRQNPSTMHPILSHQLVHL